MNTIKKIAKNTGILFISNIVTFILGFLYIVYTARYLGAESFGILSFALAFAGIFGVFTDLGLATLTTREVSRNKSLAGKYLVNIAVIKILLAIITLCFIALAVHIIGYPQNIANVIYLVSLSPIFGNFTGLFNSIFQAYEKMEYFALAQTLSSFLMFLGILLAICYKFDVVGFAFIYFIVSVIVFLYALLTCLTKFVKPNYKLDLSFWKPIILEALPFGLTGLFLSIYFWIDSLMLSFMVGNEAVGLYNVAYRFLSVLLFIPTLFSITVFPAMSKFFITSPNKLKFVQTKYFKYMAVIGIPIGVGVTLLANKIILLIFGSGYAESTMALQILVWAAVLIFMSSTFARLLESSNRQIIMTKITLICAIANILLNLFTIPILSFLGASISTVLTELLALIMVILVSSKIGYFLSKDIFKTLIKISIASLLMGILIILLNDLDILIIIPISTLLYFTFFYIFKGFDNDDIKILNEIIRMK